MKDREIKPSSFLKLIDEKLEKELKKLSESNLTKKVVIPVFSSIGFERVNDYGGPYEGGKDIICWRTDELGLPELAVAQVKKFKPTTAASDKHCFSEIITQLQQASEKEVPNIDGKKYIPSIIYFVTPYSIDTRALQSRFEGYSSLRPRRVKIIDGPLLVKLIQDNVPEIAEDLVGEDIIFRSAMVKNLTNKDLLNALGAFEKSNITDYYCDLDFGLGRVTTRLFFSLDFQPTSLPISIWDEKQDEMIKVSKEAERFFKVKLISSANKRNKDQVMYYLNGQEIAKALDNKQKWLIDSLRKFQRHPPRSDEFKQFLIECSKLFEISQKVLENRYIRRAVGISVTQKYRKFKREARASISIHSIFNTGLNIALFGEAGAGKTTTLQMHALKRINECDDSELVLFLPLGRIVSEIKKVKLSEEKKGATEQLEYGIIAFLQNLGLNMQKKSFADIIKSKRKVLFLIDGVDEAISRFPKIIDAIEGLPKRFPNSRLIISSRMSGDYIQWIPFLGVTLLPFNNEQRIKFINGWFGVDHKEKANSILRHLDKKPKLRTIISNPLYATILCFLTENDVPLPDTEVRLYEERMRLLLGHYDIYKKAYRLKTHKNLLELIARKLAYYFHVEETRQQSFAHIANYTTDILGNRYNTDQIKVAVNELLDPCNILVPMTEDGKLGFGHFRFQEYLVACELRINRSIDVIPLMQEHFWRGALELFALMSDDIDFVIDWILNNEVEDAFISTAELMFKNRSKKERLEFKKTLKVATELDVISSFHYEEIEEIAEDDMGSVFNRIKKDGSIEYDVD